MSIVNDDFVGDATGVADGSSSVAAVAEALAMAALALARCVAAADGWPVTDGISSPPALTPGTAVTTAIQPTAAMRTHSAA
jgi:hypothetical protein